MKERRIPSWGISIIQGFLFLSTFSRGHLWEVLLFKDSYVWSKFSTTQKAFSRGHEWFCRPVPTEDNNVMLADHLFHILKKLSLA